MHIHEVSVALHAFGTKGLIHTNGIFPDSNMFPAPSSPELFGLVYFRWDPALSGCPSNISGQDATHSLAQPSSPKTTPCPQDTPPPNHASRHPSNCPFLSYQGKETYLIYNEGKSEAYTGVFRKPVERGDWSMSLLWLEAFLNPCSFFSMIRIFHEFFKDPSTQVLWSWDLES